MGVKELVLEGKWVDFDGNVFVSAEQLSYTYFVSRTSLNRYYNKLRDSAVDMSEAEVCAELKIMLIDSVEHSKVQLNLTAKDDGSCHQSIYSLCRHYNLPLMKVVTYLFFNSNYNNYGRKSRDKRYTLVGWLQFNLIIEHFLWELTSYTGEELDAKLDELIETNKRTETRPTFNVTQVVGSLSFSDYIKRYNLDTACLKIFDNAENINKAFSKFPKGLKKRGIKTYTDEALTCVFLYLYCIDEKHDRQHLKACKRIADQKGMPLKELMKALGIQRFGAAERGRSDKLGLCIDEGLSRAGDIDDLYNAPEDVTSPPEHRFVRKEMKAQGKVSEDIDVVAPPLKASKDDLVAKENQNMSKGKSSQKKVQPKTRSSKSIECEGDTLDAVKAVAAKKYMTKKERKAASAVESEPAVKLGKLSIPSEVLKGVPYAVIASVAPKPKSGVTAQANVEQLVDTKVPTVPKTDSFVYAGARRVKKEDNAETTSGVSPVAEGAVVVDEPKPQVIEGEVRESNDATAIAEEAVTENVATEEAATENVVTENVVAEETVTDETPTVASEEVIAENNHADFVDSADDLEMYQPVKDSSGCVYTDAFEVCSLFDISVEDYKQKRAQGMTPQAIIDCALQSFEDRTDVYGNVFDSVAAMCKRHNVSEEDYRSRLADGWNKGQALGLVAVADDFVVDHLGNKYKSTQAMCDYWNVSVPTFKLMQKKGKDIEYILTNPHLKK